MDPFVERHLFAPRVDRSPFPLPWLCLCPGGALMCTHKPLSEGFPKFIHAIIFSLLSVVVFLS